MIKLPAFWFYIDIYVFRSESKYALTEHAIFYNFHTKRDVPLHVKFVSKLKNETKVN